MKHKSLVIFDMDGTLIDSSLAIANAINYVRSQLGLPPMAYDHIVAHVNDHTIKPAKFFYGVDTFLPIHEQWFSQYYTLHHSQELRLYDGIPQLLKWLKGKGVHLSVATNAYRKSALESLEYFGISSLFDVVACADDVEQGKPAPDMLFKILEKLNVDLDDTVFVGDGPRDLEAAQAAGMDYLMVDWGFTDHNDGTRVIKSVEELRNKLESLIA